MQPFTLEDVIHEGAQPWQLNNAALKSIRDTNENPPGWPSVSWDHEGCGYAGVELFDHDPYPIKTLRRTTGMHYELTDPEQPWSWRKMLNNMVSDKTTATGYDHFFCFFSHSLIMFVFRYSLVH